jgi:Bifunctional DNA primase/polymerase, N-terminal/AAA domain
MNDRPEFKQIALPMAARGLPVIRIHNSSKRPIDSGWPNLATTDPAVIEAWSKETPSAGCACVAKHDGYVFFECDDKAELDRFEKETGESLKTFTVQSSPGKFHFYLRQTDLSRKIGNISQKLIPSIGSLRQNNAYVVAAGSLHEKTGLPYKIVDNSPIIDAPEALLKWLDAQRTSSAPATTSDKTSAPIPTEPSGLKITVDPELMITEARDNTMASIAGSLRQHNCNWDEIHGTLLTLVDNHMVQPEGDRKTDKDARRIADSYSRDSYAPSQEPPVVTVMIGGKPIIPGEGTVLVGLHITKDKTVEEVREIATAPTTDAKGKTEEVAKTCLDYFRSVGEMEEGPIVEVIDGVLQEGTCFLGATPASGKTLVSLSFAKAISTGKPLFGIPQYKVKEPRQVIYLIPESGDHAFRKRCEAFGIPNDKRRFMARTISAGVPLQLDSPILLEAVRQTKPVVFLDTASRFMKSKDENAAAQNQLLVNDVVALLAAGAVTVVLVHHATKNSKKESMTLENMLRGTGDFGAMCDQAYGIRKDDALYANGIGPMEIDMVNLKDREQTGGLTKLRLAASYTTLHSIGAISYINTEGDFKVVDNQAIKQRVEDLLIKYVTEDPTVPETEIVEELGLNMSGRTVRRLLNRLGWHRTKGGPEGASPWHNDEGKPCPYLEEQQDAQTAKDAAKKAAIEARAAKEAAKADRKRLKFKPSDLKKQATIEDFVAPVKGEVELVDPGGSRGNQ